METTFGTVQRFTGATAKQYDSTLSA